jgi:putative peptide zinc metalloprotease protein
MWVLVPIGKFIRYLAVGPELSRNRSRAINVTLATTAAMVVLLCVIKFPDYCRVEGFVEPVDLSVIHMETDGFITDCLPSGSMVEPDGKFIVKAYNKVLETEKQSLLAQLTAFEVRRQIAATQEVAAAQIITEQIETIKEQIIKVDHQLSMLNLRAPKAGRWVSPDIERIKGGYIRRGERIGYVAHFDDVIIRATATQDLAALLVEQAHKDLEIRVKSCPRQKLNATLEQIFPAGHEILPSKALGYAVGGTMATETRDPRGIQTAEKFFEVRIRPEQSDSIKLITGQRVIARIQLRSKPLAMQWWYLLRQLFQRRFHI